MRWIACAIVIARGLFTMVVRGVDFWRSLSENLGKCDSDFAEYLIFHI